MDEMYTNENKKISSETQEDSINPLMVPTDSSLK